MRIIRHLTAAALALPALAATAHANPPVRLATGNNACQPGEVVLSMEEAEAIRPQLCAMLPPWHIVRLADGGVIDGPGYGCHIYEGHPGGLGHTFCMPADFTRGTGDGICPEGTVLADKASAEINRAEACGILGPWDIARLSDGGSIDGRGYGCGARATDARGLGHSLCRTTFLETGPEPLPAIALETGMNRCQPGFALLTREEAAARHAELCAMLPPWHIVRLADGGVMDGPGYGCHIYTNPAMSLGHTFCVEAEFSRGVGDGICPDGTLLADKTSADINRAEACGVLGRWDIARLSGGGSMDGGGYGCGTRVSDARGLGHALCRSTAL